MRKSSGWRLAAMVVLLSLSACAGRAAPPPGPLSFSANDTAIVRGGPSELVYLLGTGHVTVTRIDDTQLVDGANRPLYRTIEITAGFHAVYFNYRHTALCASGSACAMSLSRDRKLSLKARPGHVYRVSAAYKAGRLWTWIVDESDGGRQVAGKLPSGGDWAAGVQGIGGGQVF